MMLWLLNLALFLNDNADWFLLLLFRLDFTDQSDAFYWLACWLRRFCWISWLLDSSWSLWRFRLDLWATVGSWRSGWNWGHFCLLLDSWTLWLFSNIDSFGWLSCGFDWLRDFNGFGLFRRRDRWLYCLGFRRVGFFLWLLSSNWLHASTKQKIVHIFLKIGPSSIGIKTLLFVLGFLVVIVDPETPSGHLITHFPKKYLIKN